MSDASSGIVLPPSLAAMLSVGSSACQSLTSSPSTRCTSITRATVASPCADWSSERSGFAQVQLPHAAREGLLRLALSAAMCEHVPASHNHNCVSRWKMRSTTDEPELRFPPHDAALNDQHPVIEESGARAVASDTVHRTQVIQPVD
jgi:hypothetical protein